MFWKKNILNNKNREIENGFLGDSFIRYVIKLKYLNLSLLIEKQEKKVFILYGLLNVGYLISYSLGKDS